MAHWEKHSLEEFQIIFAFTLYRTALEMTMNRLTIVIEKLSAFYKTAHFHLNCGYAHFIRSGICLVSDWHSNNSQWLAFWGESWLFTCSSTFRFLTSHEKPFVCHDSFIMDPFSRSKIRELCFLLKQLVINLRAPFSVVNCLIKAPNQGKKWLSAL